MTNSSISKKVLRLRLSTQTGTPLLHAAFEALLTEARNVPLFY
jgi:hypothetical protein